ncbi:MAG TPA: hypothetical protein VF072_00685 [Thermoleophilaceae bacterium]
MHYCGVVPMQRALQLALLEEVRDPDPPIRLSALFYEPGTPEQVATELRRLGDVVVGLGPGAEPVSEMLSLELFQPENRDRINPVPEGAYQETPLFRTDPDRVFWALQGKRLPAKRHPYGLQLRIDELEDDHIVDEGGDLWHRRIEEIDALACALCAHRYAVGHASVVDGVVLPGTSLPNEFTTRGVMPPVERLTLPDRA